MGAGGELSRYRGTALLRYLSGMEPKSVVKVWTPESSMYLYIGVPAQHDWVREGLRQLKQDATMSTVATRKVHWTHLGSRCSSPLIIPIQRSRRRVGLRLRTSLVHC